MLPLAACLALFAPEVRLAADGAVEVVGLKARPGDTMTLHAGDGTRAGMLGESSVVGGVLRFKPRFPLKPGLRHVAVVKSGGAAPLSLTLLIPARKREPSAFVAAVYPSTDRLPENQLKFYIHFSAPMRQGKSYTHIRLLDGKGKEIDLPFLELDEELWDAEGKRLTVFIDPGRIKRFLKPREEVGPALEQGQRYTLAIDKGWRDADGVPMKGSFAKEFIAGPPDETPPDPKKWKLSSPKGRQPLRVAFGKPMDHALALRLLWVEDADGRKIAGTATLTEKESVWLFRPSADWKPGTHHLVAGILLEDLSGNGIGRPFEVDLLRPAGKRVEGGTVKVPFRTGE